MPRPEQDEPQSPSKRSLSDYGRWIFVGGFVIVAVWALVWALQPWWSTTDPAPPPALTREEIAAIYQRAEERKEGKKVQDAEKIEWVRNLESFRDCDACPEMVVIPAASFVMGSRKRGDWDKQNNENPPRQVTVQSFIVARHQVSLDEWVSCVDDGRCAYRPDPRKPPYPDVGEGTQPVTGVSWNDARDYVRWLSRQTGKDYCLPTEAEWVSRLRWILLYRSL
jgi:formylglycine-generating enzyme required for sulfatase activity